MVVFDKNEREVQNAKITLGRWLFLAIFLTVTVVLLKMIFFRAGGLTRVAQD